MKGKKSLLIAINASLGRVHAAPTPENLLARVLLIITVITCQAEAEVEVLAIALEEYEVDTVLAAVESGESKEEINALILLKTIHPSHRSMSQGFLATQLKTKSELSLANSELSRIL